MDVNIFGSSSKGNCAVIDGCIIIDAGVSDGLAGCYAEEPPILLLTHAHTDHTKALDSFTGVPTYCLPDTAAKLAERWPYVGFGEVAPNRQLTIGNYVITPVELEHDVPCVGYDIARFGENPKRILYASDFNSIVDDERFVTLLYNKTYDHLYVECNNTLGVDALFYDPGVPVPRDEFHKRRAYNDHCNVGYLINLFKRAGYSASNPYTEPVTLLHKSSFYYHANPVRVSHLCTIANVLNPLAPTAENPLGYINQN